MAVEHPVAGLVGHHVDRVGGGRDGGELVHVVAVELWVCGRGLNVTTQPQLLSPRCPKMAVSWSTWWPLSCLGYAGVGLRVDTQQQLLSPRCPVVVVKGSAWRPLSYWGTGVRAGVKGLIHSNSCFVKVPKVGGELVHKEADDLCAGVG